MGKQYVVGVPKELLNNENRVAMTPAGVEALVQSGHRIVVERGAGAGSGFTDNEYEEAGAELVPSAADAWRADIVLKVKEPLQEEFAYFRKGLIIFTYLHLAAEPTLTESLVAHGVSALAYETVQLANGSLPLLTPMSEVAGRMAVQLGARYLEKPHGGRGVLLGGIPGVPPGNVVVIGGGAVGTNAAKIALGLGANVVVLDVNAERLRQLEDILEGRINLVMSNRAHIAEAVRAADLLVGAVLIPGARAPKLVTEEMVREMSPGSVIVDVAVDQGGTIETVDRVTSHSEPTYVKHGVIHYAVPNIPGAVPRTSTIALTNVTMPYVEQLLAHGLEAAVRKNEALARGVNVYDGSVTYKAVADELGMPYVPLEQKLSRS